MKVKARQLIDIIVTSFQIQEVSDSVLVPLVVGQYGVGKTTLVKMACKITNLNPIFVILTGFDPSLWQIPSRSSSSENAEVYDLSTLKFLSDPHNVLILDEIHLADKFELNPLVSILVGRKIVDIRVNCKIVCLANNDLILKNPSFSSRLMPLYLEIPDYNEVIDYIISQHSQVISASSKFAQTLIAAIFEYVKLFGVHDNNDIPSWTPRTIESLVLYICQHNPTQLDNSTVAILFGHLRHRYDEFLALLDQIRFPDPHTNDPNEIVEFLSQPIVSAHFAFTRIYTTHLVTCDQHHPLDPVQFVTVLPSSLIDVFVTTLQSIRNPRVSEIIAKLSENPQTANLISAYTTMSIK